MNHRETLNQWLRERGVDPETLDTKTDRMYYNLWFGGYTRGHMAGVKLSQSIQARAKELSETPKDERRKI